MSEKNITIQNSQKDESLLFKQLSFFIPLGITGFLLTFTGSVVNAGLARLPSPTIFISAFAVARSFMQFIISPLHMIRPTVTALTRDKTDYFKVRRFVVGLAALVVAVLALFSLTGIARWIFHHAMGLKGQTLDASVVILRVLTLYPIGLLLKDFFHGVLIKFEKTSLITAGTIIRIIVVATIAASINKLTFMPDAVLAGLIFLSASFAEGTSAFLSVKMFIGSIPAKLDKINAEVEMHDHESITHKKIISFYWPLAVTTLIKTLAMPIINSGLARTDNAEIALSVFAVAWGLSLTFISPLNMFHQVSLRFTENDNAAHNQKVMWLGLSLGGFISFLLCLVSLTGLGKWILIDLIGVSEPISKLAIEVIRITIFFPVITVLREYYWGILIKKRITKFLGIGKVINLLVLILALYFLIEIHPSNTALSGIIAILLADSSEFTFMFLLFLKAARK